MPRTELTSLGEPTTFEALKPAYGTKDWWDWFAETEPQNDPETNGVVGVRIVRGGVRIAGDLVTDRDLPWAVIIDGDLEVRGDIHAVTGEYLVSTLIVTGNVRARNVLYRSSARVGIYGDLVVDGVVVGMYGDSGACLGARSISARIVAVDSNTSVGSERKDKFIDAIVIGGRGWREFDPDVRVDDAAAIGEEFFDPDALWDRAVAGEPLVDAAAEAALRAKKGLPPLAERLRATMRT